MNQQLIEENMKLVYHVINQFYPNMIMDEDIIQCGMVGLCKAANTWDESLSKFSTYACRCIGYEIGNELKYRKRQINTLSFEHPVKSLNGKVTDFGDLIAGDNDVDYVDTQPYYDSLNPKEKAVLTLLQKGLNAQEIALQLGVSRQTAYYYIRRLRTLWRNHYGD